MEKPPIAKANKLNPKAETPKPKFSTKTSDEEILSTPRSSLKHEDDIKRQNRLVSCTPDDALPPDLQQVKYNLLMAAEGKPEELGTGNIAVERLKPGERERLYKMYPILKTASSGARKRVLPKIAMIRSTASQIDSYHGEHRKIAMLLKEEFPEEWEEYTLDEVEEIVREALLDFETGGEVLHGGSTAQDFLRASMKRRAREERGEEWADE